MLHIKHQRRVIAGYPDFNVLHSSLSSGIFWPHLFTCAWSINCYLHIICLFMSLSWGE
jgi:hypothetical protein